MGWLKAWASLNAAWDRDVIRTRAGTPHKKQGKKKENMKKIDKKKTKEERWGGGRGWVRVSCRRSKRRMGKK
jgi:hypothetical protein